MEGSLFVEFAPLAPLLHEPIPFGTTWMVSGEPGTGKTTLGFQFVMQGLRRGESAVFVACDEPPARIKRNLRAFGFGTSAYEREGRFLLIDAFSPSPEEIFFVSDRADVEEFTYVIAQAVAQLPKPCRVVVDSMTTVAVNFEVREFLYLVYEKNRIFRESPVVVMDIYLADTFQGSEMAAVVNSYDLALELFVSEERGGFPKRSLRLRKLRGGTYDPRPYPFTIRPHQGIVVDSEYYRE